MTLSRAILIFLLACASAFAVAAEPKSDASTNSSSPSTSELNSNLEVPRLVPWFTGFKKADGDQAYDRVLSALHNRPLLLPGTLGEKTCLKLRAYKVKRQEKFREGESASLGYSTCQWASKYQIHSALQTVKDPSH